MNRLVNDRDELVIAVGAPNSVERAKCEFPATIEKLLNAEKRGTLNSNKASRFFNCAKVFLIVDRLRILEAAGFDEQQARRLGGAI